MSRRPSPLASVCDSLPPYARWSNVSAHVMSCGADELSSILALWNLFLSKRERVEIERMVRD